MTEQNDSTKPRALPKEEYFKLEQLRLVFFDTDFDTQIEDAIAICEATGWPEKQPATESPKNIYPRDE